MTFKYDIALSFAGEDREYVESVAHQLRQRGIRLFYDRYEAAGLWGKDLYVHLSEIYSSQARYFLMFISKVYAAKVWTSHERRAAQARALTEQSEYILPLRLDDVDVPGILPTIGYIKAADFTVSQIADLVVQKVNQAKWVSSDVSTVGLFVDIPYLLHASTEAPLTIAGAALLKFARSIGALECAWAAIDTAQTKGAEIAKRFAALGFLVAHPVKRGQSDFALLERITQETMKGRVGTYVLVTGDGDFLDKVMGLMLLGHSVHLVANSQSLFDGYRKLLEERRHLGVVTGTSRDDFIIHELRDVLMQDDHSQMQISGEVSHE